MVVRMSANTSMSIDMSTRMSSAFSSDIVIAIPNAITFAIATIVPMTFRMATFVSMAMMVAIASSVTMVVRSLFRVQKLAQAGTRARIRFSLVRHSGRGYGPPRIP